MKYKKISKNLTILNIAFACLLLFFSSTTLIGSTEDDCFDLLTDEEDLITKAKSWQQDVTPVYRDHPIPSLTHTANLWDYYSIVSSELEERRLQNYFLMKDDFLRKYRSELNSNPKKNILQKSKHTVFGVVSSIDFDMLTLLYIEELRIHNRAGIAARHLEQATTTRMLTRTISMTPSIIIFDHEAYKKDYPNSKVKIGASDIISTYYLLRLKKYIKNLIQAFDTYLRHKTLIETKYTTGGIIDVEDMKIEQPDLYSALFMNNFVYRYIRPYMYTNSEVVLNNSINILNYAVARLPDLFVNNKLPANKAQTYGKLIQSIDVTLGSKKPNTFEEHMVDAIKSSNVPFQLTFTKNNDQQTSSPYYFFTNHRLSRIDFGEISNPNFGNTNDRFFNREDTQRNYKHWFYEFSNPEFDSLKVSGI